MEPQRELVKNNKITQTRGHQYEIKLYYGVSVKLSGRKTPPEV